MRVIRDNYRFVGLINHSAVHVTYHPTQGVNNYSLAFIMTTTHQSHGGFVNLPLQEVSLSALSDIIISVITLYYYEPYLHNCITYCATLVLNVNQYSLACYNEIAFIGYKV